MTPLIRTLCKKYFKTILIIQIVFFIFNGVAAGQLQPNTFELKGHIKINESTVIYISYYSYINDIGITDSCTVVDGDFQFKGNINNPVVAFVRLKNSNIIDENTAIIFLEPNNMEATFTKAPLFTPIKFSGSNSQTAYDSLLSVKNNIFLAYKNKIEELKTEKNENKKDSLRMVLKPFYDAIAKEDYKFFDAHPTSFVTGYRLQFYYNILLADILKNYYDKMGDVLQQSIFGKRLAEVIQTKKNSATGIKVVDFSSIDINGDSLSLSDYRGKYVLLDFWASWCVPCRAGVPHLKELFKRYKTNGFEVIGIASDDRNPTAWRKAVTKDKLPWRNILNGAKKESDPNDIGKRFDVSVLPTQILIDKKGVVVFRSEGSNDTLLDRKLAEIFK